ncbi:CPBP family intramembrane glutamic endopeptidase [Haliscomenobacter hydrossis]|uniref:Abortive infection protein n=1 Tax=Haliscomenobacter hydrossis (strain ATCC 27775 / DSM 1100 / LMG 10767 / O) TaxID=760192 RepID=F4L7C4_HALH1|nr:CPBP family intramembrane glutamic endopeptidase [Haliscomenobacter hydrossis]AEE53151.1 Abortive infection protein [Haliscomenobacter hydrossis DSM 1100]
MKKNLTSAILIAIGFIALLWFEKPLRTWFINNGAEALTAKFSAGTMVRLLLFSLALGLIYRLNLQRFAGFSPKMKVHHLQSTMIALAFIAMGIVGNYGTYVNSEPRLLLLFFTSVMCVGLVEEFVFRGLVLPLFIKSFQTHKNALLLSVLCSSLLFGVVHFLNLFQQPDNLLGITSQVFFAISIGVFFGGLMLRTRNILVPAILHGLVNFAFGAAELKAATLPDSTAKLANGADWNSIVPTAIFFLFILYGGLFMVKKSDANLVLSKLN